MVALARQLKLQARPERNVHARMHARTRGKTRMRTVYAHNRVKTAAKKRQRLHRYHHNCSFSFLPIDSELSCCPPLPIPPPPPSSLCAVLNGSSHSPTSLNGAPSTPNGFSNGPAMSSTASLSNQQLPPACGARQLCKLKRFLTTLQQFGNDISPEIGERVRSLVLGLVVSFCLCICAVSVK